MAPKTQKTASTEPKKEKNYVLVNGQKVSRTWAAMQGLKGGTILDMKAVLK